MSGRHRLFELYSSATPLERVVGATWYHEAHDTVLELGAEYQVTPLQVATAIATTSPMMPWDKNVDQAEELLSVYRDGGTLADVHFHALTRNVAAAWRNVVNYRFPSGPKVCPFAHNLLLDLEPVTIDRHMVAAWRGHQQNSNCTLGELRTIQADITWLAAREKRRPAVMQAILWVTEKTRREQHQK